VRTVWNHLALAIAAAGIARAQSNVDPTDKLAWGENVGWLNWRDAGNPAGAQGVRVHNSYLSGFIWAENVGWINLGDGVPANGIEYANANGADFGVNRETATNELFGLAWGENVGWINFDGGALAVPANPARLDLSSCRLRGYAWGENIGWINLDDAGRFVSFDSSVCNGMPCPGDVDDDDDIDLSDLAILLAHFGVPSGAGPEDGDLDGDGDVDLNDLAGLLARFGSSCS
jgi:hypothetical protein